MIFGSRVGFASNLFVAESSSFMSPAKPLKVGIAVARFNDLITSRLQEGARNLLQRRGVAADNIVIKEVPGAFELPLAAQWLLEQGGCQGVVALGAVIKGSTDHYEYVCSSATSGLMNVQLKTSCPVGFGVLTCDTLEQAFDRAGGKLGNKGAETAETVLEMIEWKAQWNSQGVQK
jgi:6,7-dimethyl-8-ribityllumazine synthase